MPAERNYCDLGFYSLKVRPYVRPIKIYGPAGRKNKVTKKEKILELRIPIQLVGLRVARCAAGRAAAGRAARRAAEGAAGCGADAVVTAPVPAAF